MTIEQEARDLLNSVSVEQGRLPCWKKHDPRQRFSSIEAVCRALEQRNAERQAHAESRQRVSDAVEQLLSTGENYEKLHGSVRGEAFNNHARSVAGLRQFIIPKPVDPLIEALATVPPIKGESYRDYAERLRAACIKHGIPIPDKREEG